uniref:Protein archease-like n=1 Tax=Chromera velia CCMP2878 TaxID=1169474 RepID=A0A0G4GCK9_9ALVE|eukprot:Cvel_21166.t1-p1 / transcript=Cvel_21166.t1 / gene=Cvel_21166 / organism=Chromera_velia_CCMP2878 / gene_product=Protein archease-like, putative / transcript_product=Protein archease-like, putative / location=Cvel_scaffold1964:11592-15011(-) / protein_length=252 / sequence_SO=supercontig / SO=protein_coding / is_pseudo=false
MDTGDDGSYEVDGVRIAPQPPRRNRGAPAPPRQDSEGSVPADPSGSSGQEGDGGAGGIIEVSQSALDRLQNFEYQDHTADVIVHAWGEDLKGAFESACVGMFNYMTDLTRVETRDVRAINAKGHDLKDLLFHLLDECLFLYGSEYFVCRAVEIVSSDFSGENGKFRVDARGYGETFCRERHSQGTEIKAITMHEMNILLRGAAVEGVDPGLGVGEGVSVDPPGEKEGGGVEAEQNGGSSAQHPAEVWVLVDI